MGKAAGSVGFARNLRAILTMASNPVQEKRIKHMDIRYHFICQVVKEGKVALYYIEGDKNPADMFTKNLRHLKFLHFRGQLGLEFYSPKDA